MTQLLKGDSDCSDDSLYEEDITIEDAELISLDLKHELGLAADYQIVAGRGNGALFGTCRETDEEKTFKIVLHKRGLNVGTLLHEMAHVSFSGMTISGHGPDFRRGLSALTKAYNHLKGM